jgi:hypothetical protein
MFVITTDLQIFLLFPRAVLIGITERRGRVVNISASYLEGPEFKSQPRRPAILTEVFRGFPQSLQANARIVPQN